MIALRIFHRLLIAIPVIAGGALAVAAESLEQQGYAVLKKYCHRCHGVDRNGNAALDMDRRDSLLEKSKDEDLPYITPGKPAESLIWQRVAEAKDMPPEDEPQPTAEEVATLERWIKADLQFPARPKRDFVSLQNNLAAIDKHLDGVAAEDRRFQRYYTFSHLYNNHERVTEDAMRSYRAALSKVVNSLSWESTIVVPRPIDEAQTVFAIDLRDYGWDKANLWSEILKVYPYGLKFDGQPGEVGRLALNIYQKSGSDLPFVRADWFINTATRPGDPEKPEDPGLYHILLQLPKTADALERLLRTDVLANFRRDRLARAGFAKSGISGQNRLVERHGSAYGGYWKSYDFKPNAARGNLFKLPLGPAFNGNPFAEQAFVHDGGEIIFNLPNGLQAYLLIDGKGNRINAGPIDVVSDRLKTSGTAFIVNGLSCIVCHKNGMNAFKDTVRSGAGVFGEAKRKVERLYPDAKTMNRHVSEDSQRFLKALEQATGAFVQIDESKGKSIEEFEEPVGDVVGRYLADLSAEDLALELGMEDPKELKTAVRLNPQLKVLGLGPIVDGDTIKRESWESLAHTVSAFQKAASELELGVPFRQFQ